MELTHLSLTNFRSYQRLALGFGQHVIFIGPNGIGKTNLLEAIYLLAVMKSYRAASDAEVIRFGEEFAKVTGKIENRELKIENGELTNKAHQPKNSSRITSHNSRLASSDELEIVIHKGEKRAKKNGVAKPLTQLIGTLKAVLFSPDQIDLIVGPPRRRRRFLDSLLCQIDLQYTQHLLAYQKALRQRNALLLQIKQGQADAAELYFWDQELIKAGGPLAYRRRQVVEWFNRELPTCYSQIASQQRDLRLLPRWSAVSAAALSQSLRHDVLFAATTVGPHRDNFTVTLGGKDLGVYGSRGEWRSALLAMKVAETSFLAHETSLLPLLLLDDVFSELDEPRRAKLLEVMGKGQTFLTTTDLSHIDRAVVKNAQIVEVGQYATP